MTFISTVQNGAGRVWSATSGRARGLWTRYRGLKKPWQIAIPVALLLIILGLAFVLLSKKPADTTNALRTVTLASVASLSGNGDAVSVIGNVRSVSEADVLAQSGGTVRRLHTRLGASVPAGFVIAELENASERAVVLQAQGAYEAALAARSITLVQAGSTGASLEETERAVRNAYRSGFTTLDNSIENYVDPLLTGEGRVAGIGADLAARRAAIGDDIRAWRASLDSVDSQSPEALLTRAEDILRRVSEYLEELSRTVNSRDSGATATQKAGLATARASVDSLLATISSQREALRAAQTATSVASRQTSSTGGRTASADASVKQALGSLRLAQASLEKTIIRAPIAGSVNFLPIGVGDYVTSFMHVATIANNGSLEIVTYVSEDDRELIAAGQEVKVEETYTGIITSIAPALDASTKRIEVRIAVSGETELVNGQTVRIAFANVAPKPTSEQAAGPVLLPLASVKLRTDDRVVFTVGEDKRLVAVPVEIGEVRGDRIEILSALPLEVQIVTDARGLAEGQQVQIATP